MTLAFSAFLIALFSVSAIVSGAVLDSPGLFALFFILFIVVVVITVADLLPLPRPERDDDHNL